MLSLSLRIMELVSLEDSCIARTGCINQLQGFYTIGDAWHGERIRSIVHKNGVVGHQLLQGWYIKGNASEHEEI